MSEGGRKVLMIGNDALCRGAIDAGCRFYAGYPITPQNETIEYMATHLEAEGGKFVQAESELAAINMVLGAAVTGVRAMTSSSSPGISLMQEGISYMAGMRVPALIANIVRGGPGLGNISAAQSDYFQATRGGGHGDYHTPVLAPYSVQEMYDLVFDAFDIADRCRTPTMILADGMLGQMAEPLMIGHRDIPKPVEKPWALNGADGRAPNSLFSLLIGPGRLEGRIRELQEAYDSLKPESRWETLNCEDAESLLVAYGSSARFCTKAVSLARSRGIKLGLFRPISLFPFPADALLNLVSRGIKDLLVVELSAGQMVQDVKLSLWGCDARVRFYGRAGGVFPTTEGILAALRGEPEDGSFYQA